MIDEQLIRKIVKEELEKHRQITDLEENKRQLFKRFAERALYCDTQPEREELRREENELLERYNKRISELKE